MNRNNGQGKLPPSNIPLLRPTADAVCWVCGKLMKVPAEMLKNPRVVCGDCGREFDVFIWSLFKNAKQAKKEQDARRQQQQEKDAQ